MDGGRTWTVRSIDAGNLSAVAFVGPRDGWAAGVAFSGPGPNVTTTSLILHTSDGGHSWSPHRAVLVGTTGYLEGVAFANAQDGCAVGIGGAAGRSLLLVTRDGGRTWTCASVHLTFAKRPVALVPRGRPVAMTSAARVVGSLCVATPA